MFCQFFTMFSVINHNKRANKINQLQTEANGKLPVKKARENAHVIEVTNGAKGRKLRPMQVMAD